MRDWIAHPLDTHYIIGSAVGPHPFPDMVAQFQSVISEELLSQVPELTGKERPDTVLACVGGGSNAIGIFYHYLDNPDVKLIGVEAAGEGLQSGLSAATLALGREGILHGSKTILMQDKEGQVQEAHSISAGLDYPGIGPQHAHLFKEGRVSYVSVTDSEAIVAAKTVARHEGIIPALETAHAFAWLEKLEMKESDVVVLCLSGSGEKDMATYLRYEEKA
jgi:tryptophan synthase beta chain